MGHLKSLKLNPHLHIYTSSPRLLASAKLSSIANLKSSSSVSAPSALVSAPPIFILSSMPASLSPPPVFMLTDGDDDVEAIASPDLVILSGVLHALPPLLPPRALPELSDTLGLVGVDAIDGYSDSSRTDADEEEIVQAEREEEEETEENDRDIPGLALKLAPASRGSGLTRGET